MILGVNGHAHPLWGSWQSVAPAWAGFIRSLERKSKIRVMALEKIVIAGARPVGSLAAILLAKQGYHVENRYHHSHDRPHHCVNESSHLSTSVRSLLILLSSDERRYWLLWSTISCYAMPRHTLSSICMRSALVQLDKSQVQQGLRSRAGCSSCCSVLHAISHVMWSRALWTAMYGMSVTGVLSQRCYCAMIHHLFAMIYGTHLTLWRCVYDVCNCHCTCLHVWLCRLVWERRDLVKHDTFCADILRYPPDFWIGLPSWTDISILQKGSLLLLLHLLHVFTWYT